VAGAKDDSRDAFVLADSVRTDQHCFRRLTADHPDIVRIRELSRTEDSVGADLRRSLRPSCGLSLPTLFSLQGAK
jgi:hypothetical protein